MISTKPSHSATLIDTGKTNKVNQRIMKPPVVLNYNEGKQGIDLSDQLSTYYTCLRQSKKRYHKVPFERIFEVSIVDAYSIYKESYNSSRMTILEFHYSCEIFTSWRTNDVRGRYVGCYDKIRQ